MKERKAVETNVVREFVLVYLTFELSARLAEIEETDQGNIISRYRRRVRRNNPGLTKEYVREEAIRRMAKEASCYTIHYHTGELIEVIQLELRNGLRSRGSGDMLLIYEYYFPISEHDTFASPKYRKKVTG